MNKEKIIVKNKTNQDEHKKKGSWKIAYADFVTAMMAFFLIMWLISVSSQEDLEKMAGFFNMTKFFPENKENSPGITDKEISSSKKSTIVSLDQIKLEEFFAQIKLKRQEEQRFRKIINNLRTNEGMQEFLQNVFLDIKPYGLVIHIVDSIERPMFQPNTDIMQMHLKNTLIHLAEVLLHERKFFSISGHTRKSSGAYANDIWLLSFLRANQVRKFLLSQNKLFSRNILIVSGKADKDPMYFDDPENPQNIRVEIVLLNDEYLDVRYQSMPSNFLD